MDRDRVAHLHCWSQGETLLHLNVMPIRTVAAMFNSRSLTSRAFIIPRGVGLDDYNRDDIRVVETPASNGIGTARSVAKAYGSVATGGRDLGLAAGTLDAFTQPATPPICGLRDKVLHVDTAFWPYQAVPDTPGTVSSATRFSQSSSVGAPCAEVLARACISRESRRR